MQKPKSIITKNAPQAIGPYSQAIVFNNLIFCSGQIGLTSKDELAKDISTQTRQILENLKAVLNASGSSLAYVLKTTIYLTSIADFETVNTIYAEYFAHHKPARATVEVSNLPKNALVEIECIAVKS